MPKNDLLKKKRYNTYCLGEGNGPYQLLQKHLVPDFLLAEQEKNVHLSAMRSPGTFHDTFCDHGAFIE